MVAKGFVQSTTSSHGLLAGNDEAVALRLRESNKVTPFKIDKMPIEQFLARVRAETKVDITLDRSLDRELKVTMRVPKITYRTLLDRLVKRTGLKWELRYGVVYVAKPERFKKMPVLPPWLKSPALLRVRMPVAFNRVSLKKLAPTLTQLMGVPFVVPEEMASREVTAQAKDVSLRQALALMLYPGGLTRLAPRSGRKQSARQNCEPTAKAG